MELSLCANRYCNCFVYIDTFSAHEHMADFCFWGHNPGRHLHKFDDLKLRTSFWEGNQDIEKWDLGGRSVTALKVWEMEVDLNLGLRQLRGHKVKLAPSEKKSICLNCLCSIQIIHDSLS